MSDNQIQINPNKCGGLPCIRDLRVPVISLEAMIADGMTDAEILADFPYLTQEDIDCVKSFPRGGQ